MSLDANDNVEIVKGMWKGNRVGCERVVRSEVWNADIGDANVVKVDSIGGLYVPDSLEMGEPDDGGEVSDFLYYEVLDSNSEIAGYIVEYTYSNTEGGWATRYVFKYNTEKEFLENYKHAEEI